MPLESAAPYAAEDADITLRLHQAMWPTLTAEPALEKIYNEIELPLVVVLSDMEQAGVAIDTGMLATQSRELAGRISAIEQEAHREAGQPFNLGSPKQIQELLFDKLQLPVLAKTPKGAPSTAESVLQELALDYPLPRLILEYRSFSKLKSTYTDKLPLQVECRDGPGTYLLSSGGRGHRAAVIVRPESAEHPGAHRGRPAYSPGLRGPARQGIAGGRLFPDRAAHYGPPVRGRRLVEGLCGRRGRAPRDGR